MNDALQPANLLDIAATDPDPQALGQRVASSLHHDLRCSGQGSLAFLQQLSQSMGRISISSRIAIYWFIKQITTSLMNCMIGGYRSDPNPGWRILSAALDVAVNLDDKNLNRELLKLLADVAIYKSSVFDPYCSPEACSRFLRSCTGDIVTEEFKRLFHRGKIDAAWKLIGLYPSDSPAWDALSTLINMDKTANTTALFNNVCDVYTRWTVKPEKNPAAILLMLWDHLQSSNQSHPAGHFSPAFSSVFHWEVTAESILAQRRRFGEDKNLLAFLYILYMTLSSCPHAIPSIYGPFSRRFQPPSAPELASKRFIEIASTLCIFALFVGENQFSNTVRVLKEWLRDPGTNLSHLYLLIQGMTNITVMMQRSNRPASFFSLFQEIYGLLYKAVCEQPSAYDEFRSQLKSVLSSSCDSACLQILGQWSLELIAPSTSMGSDSAILVQNLSLITAAAIQNNVADQNQPVAIFPSVLDQLVNWFRSPELLDDSALDEGCSAFAKLSLCCLRNPNAGLLKTFKELFNLQQELIYSARPRVRLILPSILSAISDLPFFVNYAQISEFQLLSIYVNSLFEVLEPSFSLGLRQNFLAFIGHSQFEILPHFKALEIPSQQNWVQCRTVLLKDITELIISCYQRAPGAVNMQRQMAYSQVFVNVLRIWSSVSRDIKPEERYIVSSTTAEMLSSLLQSCTPILYWKNDPQYFVMLCTRLMDTAITVNEPQRFISFVFDALGQVHSVENRRLINLTIQLFQPYLLLLSAADWSHCLQYLKSRNRVEILRFIHHQIFLPALSSAIYSGHDCVGAQRCRKILDILCKVKGLNLDYTPIVCIICRVLQQQNYQYLHSYPVISMHILSLRFLSSKIRPYHIEPFSDPDVARWVISLCMDDLRLVSLKFVEHFPLKRSSSMADKSVLISEINSNQIDLQQYALKAIAKMSRSHYSIGSDVFKDSEKASSSSLTTTPIWDVIPALVTIIFRTLYVYRHLWTESADIIDYLMKIFALCFSNLEVVEDHTAQQSVYQQFVTSFFQFCSCLPFHLGGICTSALLMKLREDSGASMLLLANHII